MICAVGPALIVATGEGFSGEDGRVWASNTETENTGIKNHFDLESEKKSIWIVGPLKYGETQNVDLRDVRVSESFGQPVHFRC
jgi:hypothetical protein